MNCVIISYTIFPVFATKSAWNFFATIGRENKSSQLVNFFIFAKIILYRYIIAETEGKIYNFTQKGAQKLRKVSKHKKGEACGSAFYCIIL